MALTAIKFNNYMTLWHLRQFWGVIAITKNIEMSFPEIETFFLNAPPNQAIHKDTSTQSSVASRADFLSCKLKYIYLYQMGN